MPKGKRAKGSLQGLVLLHINNGKDIAEVADIVGITWQNVANTVKRLQDKGDLDPKKTYT